MLVLTLQWVLDNQHMSTYL